MSNLFEVGDTVRAYDLLPIYRRSLEWVRAFKTVFGTDENAFLNGVHAISRIDPKERHCKYFISANGAEVNFAAPELRRAIAAADMPEFSGRLRVWVDHDGTIERKNGKTLEIRENDFDWWSEDGEGIVVLDRTRVLGCALLDE